MKVIEKGTVVTSPYFGDGYVVRTLRDELTKELFVVVRALDDKRIRFCIYPQSVNRIFFLPAEFDNKPSAASYHLRWTEDFYGEYNENHQYTSVPLLWQEFIEPKKPINKSSNDRTIIKHSIPEPPEKPHLYKNTWDMWAESLDRD